jgi:hypothetical protein
MGGCLEVGLEIQVLSDPDHGYLILGMHLWGERFAASTRVFPDPGQLGDLAACVAGFPSGHPDMRSYAFGKRGPEHGGGYCGLTFRTTGHTGASVLDVDIEDDELRYSPGAAKFSIPIEASWIDRFVSQLRVVDRKGAGVASLLPSDQQAHGADPSEVDC